MSYRRRRPPLIPDLNDSGQTNNMEQLAFKYKEMCKVETSTDSDSEISPRWSDTSAMECVSSAPESGSLRRMLPRAHKTAGPLFLDPYDGSSEDSDQTNMDPSTPSWRTRQQGKGGRGRFSRRTRQFILHPPPSTGFRPPEKPRETASEQERHLLDVHMKCADDSEVWMCELTDELTGSQAAAASMEVRYRLHGDVQMPESSLERTAEACNLQMVVKRKMAVTGGDGLEHRKKQCVVHMEEEEEGGGESVSEAC
ncbi:uncharacterized protein LOC144031441 isoform X2 [Festucalex cinctus]